MCIICVSTVGIASLLAPAHVTTEMPVQAPIQITTVVKKNEVQEYFAKHTVCSKSNVNKVKGNTICLKVGKTYKWTTKKPSSSKTPKIESITYSPPSQPSANIQTCEIKENNQNLTFSLFLLILILVESRAHIHVLSHCL